MKTQNLLIALGIIIAIAFLVAMYQKKKTDAAKIASDAQNQDTCFSLPTNADPLIFGPSYWKAYETLTSNIPCGGCRGFAEQFMSFFHDLVNLKLGKPLFDPKNFSEMSSLITTVNLKGNKWPE